MCEVGRWPEHLPWVLFGLRAAPKEDCAISPAELVFGAPLTLTGQLLSPPETLVEDVLEALQNSQLCPPSLSLKGTVSRDFLLQVFFMNHLPLSP
jgi:hypothetical protein